MDFSSQNFSESIRDIMIPPQSCNASDSQIEPKQNLTNQNGHFVGAEIN